MFRQIAQEKEYYEKEFNIINRSIEALQDEEDLDKNTEETEEENPNDFKSKSEAAHKAFKSMTLDERDKFLKDISKSQQRQEPQPYQSKPTMPSHNYQRQNSDNNKTGLHTTPLATMKAYTA